MTYTVIETTRYFSMSKKELSAELKELNARPYDGGVQVAIDIVRMLLEKRNAKTL